MMKKYGFSLAVLTGCVAGLTSCQEGVFDQFNEEMVAPVSRSIELGADVNYANTRAAYDAEGAFVWSASDAISVWDGGNFYKLDLADGADSKNAVFSGSISAADPQFALYPYNSGHKLSSKGNLKFNFPSTYDNYVSGASNTPLYAEITSLEDGAHFTHLGATIRFKLNSLPAGVKTITVSTDVNVTGESTLTIEEGSASLEAPDGARAVNYILAAPTAEGANLVFDLPILAGTYNAFSVDARNVDGTILKTFNFIKETSVERAHIKPYSINYATSASSTQYVDNGIPQLVLLTPDKVGITSKDVYVEGSMVSLKGTDGETEFTGSMKVKGRGNSTWGYAKKPYKIKFDSKVSLFGLPKDREWVLLANWNDKSALRTDLAFYIGKELCNFDFVPSYRFVDLMLNGNYNGLYQLGEQVKMGSGRVLNGKDGYLLEVDYWAIAEAAAGEADIFYSQHVSSPFNIKAFKVGGVEDLTTDDGDANFVYIRDYVQNADNTLFSENWLDAENGYKKYIDIESFVEWYLVNEISKNADSRFFSSCYMNLGMEATDKLKMGPLWDFDIAFGNDPFGNSFGGSSANDYQGFWVKYVTWYSRLFQDPEFVALVKSRYNEIYTRKQDLMNRIDTYATLLNGSVFCDNKKWGRLAAAGSDKTTVENAQQAEVVRLKTWLGNRLDWLKTAIDAL